MKAEQLVDSKQRKLMIAGALLVGYVLLLLVIGFVGQQRLLKAQRQQQQLLLDKQAAALGYFFDVRRDDLRLLAASPQLTAYLANRALGMSMQYGLADSLFRLERRLAAMRQERRIDGKPIYLGLGFFNQAGERVVNSGVGLLDPADSSSGSAGLVLTAGLQPGRLQLSYPVIHRGQLAGRLVAEVDLSMAADSLLRQQTHLQLNRGERTIWRSDNLAESAEEPLPQLTLEGKGGAWLNAPISGVDLELRRLVQPASSASLLTSPWLGLGLLFLALLLMITFYHAVRHRMRYMRLRIQLSEAMDKERILHADNSRLMREIEKRLEAERKLHYRANFDQLTGLPNRTLVLDRLSQALLRAERNGERVVLLFLDLDHFKQVNDTLGHAAGDELLRAAADRLQALVRESDTVARLGGDEFLVLLSDLADSGGAEGVCEKILAALARPFLIQEHEFYVSTSIGIASYPEDGRSCEILLKNADIALYRVKEEGRCGYRFYSPSMDARAREKLVMESELRHAMERQEFQIHYQPVVDLADDRIAGVEALLRWENPLLGSVGPDRFIPVLEETGLIREVGGWVLERALLDIAELNELCDLSLAVNVSGGQLRSGRRFVELVERRLRNSGLPAGRLLLEITEGMLLEDGQEIKRTLADLRSLGCRLSLDDFGTGYSALGYHKRFPFDQLKIDRRFIHGLLLESGEPALVRAILALGDAMGLPVVAEGIEFEDQAVWLKTEGCRFAQGFLYSPALALPELVRFLRYRQEGVALPERSLN